MSKVLRCHRLGVETIESVRGQRVSGLAGREPHEQQIVN